MTSAAQQSEALSIPAERGACPFAPPPAYQEAREEDPVTRVRLWDGSTVWMLTRHRDVRAVLGDRRFSSDVTRPGFPFLDPAHRVIASGSPTFSMMDDPEHLRLRRMLTADFMVKKVESLRPRIREITEELLATMTRGRDRADLVGEFALPLPSLVICLLLGVPYEDHAYFQKCCRIMLDNAAGPEQLEATRADLNQYMKRLAETKRDSAGDDIISRLVHQGELTPDQIVSMCMLLLVAGHETTADMTALSILTLLQDPDQMDRLRADASLIPGAVEELLRYLTIIQTGLARVATEDVEIDGQTIRAGEGVLLMLNTANRDDRAFPAGDTLDVTRDARHHVAFGFGVHQCLGQPLARAELQIALEVLLNGLPNLRLAVPFEEIPFHHDLAIYGVHRLPIAW